MEKTLKVDGRDVTFKATGATVRLYRTKFGNDLLLDMNKLNDDYIKGDYTTTSLEVFERLAYIMAKQADESISDDIDDWFDDFGMFSIYEILPELVELWNQSTKSQIKSKKKTEEHRGK